LVAAAFRLWRLDEIPLGFFCDEAWVGNNALSLLHSGKDTTGAEWPVLFRAFAGWRSPAVVYPVLPSVALLGATEWAVRLPSALAGVITVYFTYLIGRELKSCKLGLIAAALLAVTPWHVHVSRMAFDAHVSVLSAAATIYFILRARKHPYAWPFAGFAWVSFLFSYTASFVHAGLFALAVLIVFAREARRWWQERAFQLSVAGAMIVTVGLVWFLVDNDMLFTRWRQVAPASRTVAQVLGAMLLHLSPTFLATGNENSFSAISRHAITGISELLPWQYVLLLLGGFVAIRSSRFDRSWRLLLMTLLIAPVPAALVEDRPAAIRSALLVLPLSLLSALGTEWLLQLFPRVARRGLYVALTGLLMFGGARLFRAMEAYPESSSGFYGWQHGYRDAMRWASQHDAEFEQIWITHRFNGPHELLSFYRYRYPCSSCKVMPNPIEVNSEKREFFFIRPEDVTEASVRYPGLRFVQSEIIRDTGGNTSLVGGYFTAVSPDRELSKE
jgi:4-amino-4-deoxy-L-arabinose transferase-like glycosyltransferase